MKKRFGEEQIIGILREGEADNLGEALGILTDKGLSQRSACRIAGVSRRIGSYEIKQADKDRAVSSRIIEASNCYPRDDRPEYGPCVALVESVGIKLAQAQA